MNKFNGKFLRGAIIRNFRVKSKFSTREVTDRKIYDSIEEGTIMRVRDVVDGDESKGILPSITVDVAISNANYIRRATGFGQEWVEKLQALKPGYVVSFAGEPMRAGQSGGNDGMNIAEMLVDIDVKAVVDAAEEAAQTATQTEHNVPEATATNE